MHTFLSKIKLGNYNKKQLGIIFVIGILLVIISMPTSQESSQVEEVVEIISQENVVESTDYKTQMEVQLTQVLSMVDGVGSVEVMITLESTSEKVVEKDVTSSIDETEEVTIYQDGASGQEPYVSQELYPKIEGVVVIAEGGGNAIVIQNITEAVQALFDVDTHKIKIMKMKSDQ